MARLSRHIYDAILCDLRMPRLDGPAFYDALLRADSPLRDRILFITGDTLAPRTREFLEPRQLPHLDKPFLVEELKMAVNKLLKRVEPGGAPLAPQTKPDKQRPTEAATGS